MRFKDWSLNMTKESGSVTKRRLLKTFAVCVIAASAFLLLFFAYDVNSSHTKSYKESEANINKVVAQRLNKDPNELTSEDFQKQKDMVILWNDITNLNPLVKLKNLERIDFWGFEDIDLRPLSKLKKLKLLEINFNTGHHQTMSKWFDRLFSILRISRPVMQEAEPFDFGQLKKLKNLERLVLKKYDTVRNIEALDALKNLEYLTVQPNRNKIEVAIVIPGVQGNTVLNYISEPIDLSSLQNLSKLIHLDITGVKAQGYGFIEKLTNLKYLELANTQINDIKPLESLANLEYLGLGGADIENISPLANLNNLKRLNLSSRKIKNIDALVSLSKLNELNLNYTQVSDLNVLSTLNNLLRLSLHETKISDEQITELKKGRPALMIQR
jgi:internalin A